TRRGSISCSMTPRRRLRASPASSIAPSRATARKRMTERPGGRRPDMHGILLLDKPAGMSSNAALQRVRRLCGGCKAGHAGSLDPLATGMLPLCLGEATKIAGEILSNRKRYRFTIALGARTGTGDQEGAVVEQAPVPAHWQEGLQAALQ